MSLFKVTLKSLPKATLYTHSSVTPKSHSQKSLSEVTLKSHSQKSLSKVTLKSHSQKSLPNHSQKSLSKDTLRSPYQKSLSKITPTPHTQPYLFLANADHLQHLLSGHPGLPIHLHHLRPQVVGHQEGAGGGGAAGRGGGAGGVGGLVAEEDGRGSR